MRALRLLVADRTYLKFDKSSFNRISRANFLASIKIGFRVRDDQSNGREKIFFPGQGMTSVHEVATAKPLSECSPNSYRRARTCQR